jgi:hypothetical protein
MGGVARRFDPTNGGFTNLMNLGTLGAYGNTIGGPLGLADQARGGSGIPGVGTSSFTGGGGKKGEEQPAVPDFTGAAQEQARQSQEFVDAQTRANRPNQQGPFAGSDWSRDPVTGEWTQRVTLTPGLNEAAQSITSGLGQGQLDPAAAREQAIGAAYNQATSRLDPQWAQREEQIRTRLSNQGLVPGTAAYDAAQRDLGMSRNDAYAQALYNAQTGAGNAAFGQSLAANMQPFQQLQALQGLTAQPGFTGAGQAQAPDIVGALGRMYGAQLGQYGMDQAQKNSKLQGGAALAPVLIGASDERLKESIERLPFEVIPGVPFATWEWKHRPGERQLGVIAQDVERVRPDLVIMEDGIRYVDYEGLWRARGG